MGFGSRETPRHILGDPGAAQVWRYRGMDIEVEPYTRPSGVIWAPDPSGGPSAPFADPGDAIAHARFWIDVDEWTTAMTDTARVELIHKLVSMGGVARSRARFGRLVAYECEQARRAALGLPYLGVTLCDLFDSLPLRERTKLLDKAWEEAQRRARGFRHAKRVANPGRKKKKAKTAESRRLMRRLMRGT